MSAHELDDLCNSEVNYGSCPVASRLRDRVAELEAIVDRLDRALFQSRKKFGDRDPVIARGKRGRLIESRNGFAGGGTESFLNGYGFDSEGNQDVLDEGSKEDGA